MCIRPARPSDFHDAARLIQAVFDEMSGHFASKEHKDDNPARYAWLEDWFQQETNRFSYQQVLVKEVAGKVVGAILIYPGSEAEALDRPLNERIRRLRNDPTFTLTKEADPDEFYIDTLSVSPAFSGRGYGTALIHAAEEKARELHSTKIALNVDKDNARAYRLYDHLGYQTDKQRVLYGQVYFHMVKNLAPSTQH
jgi:ribosomal protein S18 acetylase RimI-like enzyme